MKVFQGKNVKNTAKHKKRMIEVNKVNELGKRASDIIAKKLVKMKESEPAEKIVTLEIIEKQILRNK